MTQISNDYRMKTIDLLCQKLTLAESALNRSFPTPEIQFTQRGKIAGTAHLQKWMIRLNPILLNENGDAFINEVLPHELAHLIVYRVFGKVRPHGKEWRWVMESVFHREARTRHAFDTVSVQGKTFVYYCDCQEHQLSIRRHNRVIRQQTIYHCRQCKMPLKQR